MFINKQHEKRHDARRSADAGSLCDTPARMLCGIIGLQRLGWPLQWTTCSYIE